MAATGLALVGFVVAHMTGNLLVYAGREAMNDYALFLREFLHGAGLWMARAALLGAVLIHIWAAWSLTRLSHAARPAGYHRLEHDASTLASRTMRWGGVTILLFVIYHLLHLTFGTVHPDFRHGDVYHNFVTGFQSVPASLFYIAANIALGLHLYHGGWSMFRTLGLTHPRHTRTVRLAFGALAVIVALGNLSFPVAVLAGWLR